MAIDVLQQIRIEHGDLVYSIQSLPIGSEEFLGRARELKKQLMHHLAIEREYWFPEVSAAVSGLEETISECAKNHLQISALVDKLCLNSDSNEVREDLLSALDQHFSKEEYVILPRIRKVMTAEEREELAEVVADLDLH